MLDEGGNLLPLVFMKRPNRLRMPELIRLGKSLREFGTDILVNVWSERPQSPSVLRLVLWLVQVCLVRFLVQTWL
ncbi:hypothetical protein JCGZ_19518 [Jatropha curcas]|uniref:Uncharacterized protein n=1 Tax=Jatropha curcas TaxID=180498 RepID=A0A067K9I9_JATCU|nr:hypothetical protein JCGZ_19518 [Jatropha curcas]